MELSSEQNSVYMVLGSFIYTILESRYLQSHEGIPIKQFNCAGTDILET